MINYFYPRKGSKDGHHNVCKDCHKMYGIFKVCRTCGAEKNLHEFHKRANGSADGHNGECRECTNARRKELRTAICECGEEYYTDNGHTQCKKCRNKKLEPIVPVKLCTDVRCDERCAFWDDCQKRVKNLNEENWDWMPYCFVSSKYHEAYVKEYA